MTKQFGYGLLGLKKFKALSSVSFKLYSEPARIFVVIGETGSGKSTLLKLILRMLIPDGGTIVYRGRDVFRLNREGVRWYRREVQAVFQDPYESFNPIRRIDTYLYDSAKFLLNIKSREEASPIIDEVLRFVGLDLERVRGKSIKEFSGGELQRISIARAILSRPRLLLADEPVSMLDASLRVSVLNTFREIRDKLRSTIIYVTHDLATAYYIGDEIAVMYRGVLVERGPMSDVYSEPLHPYTKMLLNSILEPDIEIRKKIKPVKLSSIEIGEFLTPGCKFASRCPYAMPKCGSKEPPHVAVDERTVMCWLYVR
ncbi:MAG: ABC transporter ATP-binding protein [Ignisphaera sp.]|nr:ABC transporter ATP-binding protein [Ignisphaera sp.]MDW8084752.1 ABC transporter ATP-binding protein [Ignisphaera sp.]